jgi:tyrosine-protein kinase Etk/Wzc
MTETSASVVELTSLSGSGDSGEIRLHDLAAAVVAAKRKVICSALIAAALAAIAAFVIPPQYTAEAVILTPQQSQSSLSAMAQLAGVSSGVGLSTLSLLSGFGLHNPTDLYVGILESRTIADSLIQRFDLRRVYGSRDMHAARKRLARNTSIKAGKDTLIHIRVDDRSPQRAARVAQGYVEELARQNASVALTEASQRRMFFEAQLAKEKDLLAEAEVGMRNTQQSTGLVAPGGQAEALVRSLSQLHAEILTRQAQLEAMRSYVADNNPRYQAARRELASLQAELARLEQGKHTAGSVEVPAGALPQAGLEYLRKYRDVKYHETLFEILAKQYEAARLDEAKAAPMIQVIDKALPPERKSWPPRTLMVLLAAILGALIASFLSIWNKTSFR